MHRNSDTLETCHTMCSLLRKAQQVIITTSLPKWTAVLSWLVWKNVKKGNQQELCSGILHWWWFIWELKVTHCQTEELDRATLAGLNCQQVLRHQHAPDRRGTAASLFWQRKKCAFLKSLKNKSKCWEEEDKITPQRSLWMCGQLLRSNFIHQSACNRFIDYTVLGERISPTGECEEV